MTFQYDGPPVIDKTATADMTDPCICIHSIYIANHSAEAVRVHAVTYICARCERCVFVSTRGVLDVQVPAANRPAEAAGRFCTATVGISAKRSCGTPEAGRASSMMQAFVLECTFEWRHGDKVNWFC